MIPDLTPETDVVVVGAGPVGLTVALQAHSLGARVRIVEQRSQPRVWAPALAVQPRTMEVLRGLGVADDLLTRGLSEVELQVHIGETTVKGVLHDLRLPQTEYPFIFFVPQPQVEATLRERLEALGVAVEWETELSGLEQDQDRVRCLVRLAGDIEEEITCHYLVGCDGRESSVRRLLGVPFRGRRYRQTIIVADTEPTAELSTGTAHAFLGPSGIVFVFPLPSKRWRVIAPHPLGRNQPDLVELVTKHTDGRVCLGAVDWLEAITPHHRLAARFRSGRVFLAGDAAHVHSPAGAQGMNTGIQDGANLGWKLALVARGASEDLLDTYEQERKPVARQVVRLTGLAYALEVSDARWLTLGRRLAAKPIAQLLLPRPGLISIVARVVSGLDMRYRRGAFDRGSSRRARAGARLPDALLAGAEPSRVHRLTDGSRFHLLVFDDDSFEAIEEAASAHRTWVETHRIARSRLAGVGLRRRYPAFVLVRPDGHVAVSGGPHEVERIGDYLDRWLVRAPTESSSADSRRIGASTTTP